MKPFAYTSAKVFLCYFIKVQCYPLQRQLHSDLKDFNNGVCYAVKITNAERNPDVKLIFSNRNIDSNHHTDSHISQ